jgi:hypothetical protein
MPRESANQHVRNCLQILSELDRRLADLRLMGNAEHDLRGLVAAAERRCWGALSELEPGPYLRGPDV